MKLATFSTAQDPTPRPGAIRDGEIVDLSEQGALPRSVKALLAGGAEALTAAADALSSAKTALPLEQVRLHAPVPHPGKVLAIGLNYADHVEESGMAKPEYPLWFNKQHNCISGPFDGIVKPQVSDYLDYEAELCVVIGRRCRHVPRSRAHEVIAGYCLGNDVSVRDWQMRAQTMQIGKSFDTHGPMGPYLTTADEVEDPHALGIRGYVNGELRQDSNTKHLIFDCYDAIEHLSTAFTLDVGDVLFMGTPSGVGGAMQPPQFLKVGDTVRIEIDGLGQIENPVIADQPECRID